MWAALIPVLGNLIDKILPDPQAAAEAKIRVMELAQQGELAVLNADLQLASGQLEINKAEAASLDSFRAGWRPLIGYICAAALGWNYVVKPLVVWACAIWFPTVDIPNLVLDDNLWQLMFGMLGLGGLRTFEKLKGKA
jgi:hypothetical protein